MKKGFSIIGLIVGFIVAFLGILMIAGAFGGVTYSAADTPYPYSSSSGYAKFGADFYNYVNNNVASTASAARTTATNLNTIAHILRAGLGILMIAIGMTMACLFGGKIKESEDVILVRSVNIEEMIQKSVGKALEDKKELRKLQLLLQVKKLK